MNENLCQEINTFGFATVPQIINDKQIEKLIECLLEVNIFSVVSKKKGSFYGVRNLLNLSPKVRELAESREIKTSVEKFWKKTLNLCGRYFLTKHPKQIGKFRGIRI